MADERIPVRDKYGNVTGYRDSGAKGETAVFNPRPGGLGAVAAKAKAKPSPSPSPTVPPPASQGIDDERREKFKGTDSDAEEAKESKPAMPRKKF